MPTEPHYPAGHGWTPAGRFGPQRCKVLLARGDWITDEQAAPILAARGDDT